MVDWDKVKKKLFYISKTSLDVAKTTTKNSINLVDNELKIINKKRSKQKETQLLKEDILHSMNLDDLKFICKFYKIKSPAKTHDNFFTGKKSKILKSDYDLYFDLLQNLLSINQVIDSANARGYKTIKFEKQLKDIEKKYL